jgi:hypothetical protein
VAGRVAVGEIMVRRRRAGWVAVAALCGGVAFAAAPKSGDPKAKAPVVVAPLGADVVAEAVRNEQDAVLRRLDICDRLRRLGEETNNPALVQQADELQKQVSEVYGSRVARLGVKGPKAESSSPTVDGASVVPAAPVPAEGGRR